MGLTFLTGYILGQHGAQSARVASTAAMGASNVPAGAMVDLEERLDRLILVVDAMWSLLEDRGYDDRELIARIQEIDAADGEVDGRRRPQAATCRNCDARVPAGLSSCQFCGAAVAEAETNPIRTI